MDNMKFSAIVIRNIKDKIQPSDAAVPDALALGGIFLGEIAAIGISSFDHTLLRMTAEYDGVFVVCPEELRQQVRSLVSSTLGSAFTDEWFCGCDRIVAVLPSGERGRKTVQEQIVPAVDRRRGRRYDRMILKLMRAPGELLDSAFAAAKSISGDTLVYHFNEAFGDQRIELIYDSLTPKMVVDEVVRLFAVTFADYLYAVEDVSIAERLVDALKLHRKTVSTAESFTGGGIGGAIVSVPGASAVFYEGLNTYDSRSKVERLGVSQLALNSHGAVSEETAYQMASGLIAGGKCQLAIASTGYAGPQSDASGSSAGLCYLAVGTTERVRIFSYRLEGDREEVTKTAINLALFLAFREIN